MTDWRGLIAAQHDAHQPSADYLTDQRCAICWGRQALSVTVDAFQFFDTDETPVRVVTRYDLARRGPKSRHHPYRGLLTAPTSRSRAF